MKTIIETDRLILRELTIEDSDNLAKVLSDPISMQYYPAPFSEVKVKSWIEWNIVNYREYGHGLWAVLLKENNRFIGECGITMQDIDGMILPEIGYHIIRQFCNCGYATEAALACIKYAAIHFNYKALYTYTKFNNMASRRVAEKNGLQFIKTFKKEVMGELVQEVLYRIELQQ